MAKLYTPVAELNDEARERVSFIIQRAEKMSAAKSIYSRNWEKYEKIWKLVMEERSGEDAWRANLPETWPFATVKTAQAAFSDSRVAPVFSRHEDDDLTKSNDLTNLYTDIAEKGNLEMELYYTRLDTFKLGNGFLKTIYLNDTRIVKQIKRFDPEINEVEYEEKEINDFDDPKTIRVSPYFMLVDEMCRADFQTARDCIEIEVLGNEDAKRLYGHLVANWDESIPKTAQLNFAKQQMTQTSVAAVPETNTNRIQVQEFRFFAPLELSEDQVEILHYWNKIKNTYEIIINSFPARVNTNNNPAINPYIHNQLPYSPIQYSLYSGDEFWAAGLIELCYADARALRQYREMMNDRQRISLFSPAFSDVNDEIDQRQLKLGPMSIIRTKGGVPHQWQIPGITNADLEIEREMQESLKRAVGIDERVLGITPDTTRLTATEVNFLRENALRRLREFVFLYKSALLREVRLKIKLFDQYYASPFKKDERIKEDGVKPIRLALERGKKEFKVKIGNIYTKKKIDPNFFEGDIDVDIDMQMLLPMTSAEMMTQWGQVLRDLTPFAQAGIIDLDIEKVVEKYLDAMNVNIISLRRDEKSEAIQMAEGEHRVLANENTSKAAMNLLKEGTALQFLNAEHIKRHAELLAGDAEIETAQLENLVNHIAKDKENFKKKLEQQQAAPVQPVNPQMLGQIGGVMPFNPNSMVSTSTPTTPAFTLAK